MTTLPQKLERDDGVIFSINEDGTYSMDNSDMAEPYKYTLESLINTGAFKIVQEYSFQNNFTSDITFFAKGNSEMLRISSSGFWVRGVKIEQNDDEAYKVYQGFLEWFNKQ